MGLLIRGAFGLHTRLSPSSMSATWRPVGAALVTALALLTATGAALAQSSGSALNATQLAPVVSAWDAPEPWRTDRFYLETSVHTWHSHYDAAHDDNQRLILGEWNVTEQWLAGASFFRNSFGQPSQYVYGGFRVRPFDSVQPLYLKVSAGLVHGYSGQYRDKIPLNRSGVAPVFVPSVGYCINRYCSELAVFGGAGALLTFGVTLP